ncbi:MAG: transcription antitermination factor NusB [Candidatus Izemoplasmatales bacterium]|jgi:N utilization substance protein B|nr:transcription antitermination factor NusB [Candidatus Izemoplasmatales bacterium]
MNRRTFREMIIKLIYQDILGGDYLLDDYSKEIIETFLAVKEKYPEVDNIISSNLTNWTIDRLNYVDLAIIRYAVYEMIYLKTPPQVAINEALEITKVYSNLDDDSAKKFNNKLLDNIKKSLGKENG